VTLKIIIFWDVTPCSLLVLAQNCFFGPEDGGDMFLRNVGCISIDYTPHIPEDDILITTAVKTSIHPDIVLWCSALELEVMARTEKIVICT
jgi:hypothetical protein